MDQEELRFRYNQKQARVEALERGLLRMGRLRGKVQGYYGIVSQLALQLIGERGARDAYRERLTVK